MTPDFSDGHPTASELPEVFRYAEKHNFTDILPSWLNRYANGLPTTYDKIPRPSNAFILFRCWYSRQLTTSVQLARRVNGSPPERLMRKEDLSAAISTAWRGVSAEESARFKRLAALIKRCHAIVFPDYVFKPKRPGLGVNRPSLKNKRDSSIRGVGSHQEAQDVTFRIPTPTSPSLANSFSCDVSSQPMLTNLPFAREDSKKASLSSDLLTPHPPSVPSNTIWFTPRPGVAAPYVLRPTKATDFGLTGWCPPSNLVSDFSAASEFSGSELNVSLHRAKDNISQATAGQSPVYVSEVSPVLSTARLATPPFAQPIPIAAHPSLEGLLGQFDVTLLSLSTSDRFIEAPLSEATTYHTTSTPALDTSSGGPSIFTSWGSEIFSSDPHDEFALPAHLSPEDVPHIYSSTSQTSSLAGAMPDWAAGSLPPSGLLPLNSIFDHDDSAGAFRIMFPTAIASPMLSTADYSAPLVAQTPSQSTASPCSHISEDVPPKKNVGTFASRAPAASIAEAWAMLTGAEQAAYIALAMQATGQNKNNTFVGGGAD